MYNLLDINIWHNPDILFIKHSFLQQLIPERWIASLFNVCVEAEWPNGKNTGLAIQRLRVQVPP